MAATTPRRLPHTRAAGVRDGRAGAPLWKVTDFVPGLSDDEHAGLEAALEAAGILDAWVTPEGNLVDGDVIVVSGLAPAAGASCAGLLVPAIDPDDPQAGVLRDESVASVLRAIGRGPGTARHRRDLGDHGRALVQRDAARRLAQGPGPLRRRGGPGGRAAGADRVP